MKNYYLKKSYLIALIVLNVIKSFILVFDAFLVKELINLAVLKQNILNMSIVVIMVTVFYIILLFVYMIIRNKYDLFLETELKKMVFKEAIKKEYTHLKNVHSGKLSNMYLSDVINVTNTFSYYIPDLFLYASRFIFALIAIIILKYQILLLLIAVGGISFIFARFYSNKAKRLHKDALEKDDKLNEFMQEAIENSRYIKAMSSIDGVNNRVDKLISDDYNSKYKRNIFHIIAQIGLSILANLGYTLTMVFSAYLLYKGEISYGVLTALVSVVSYFESPFSALAQIISKIFSYKASKERIDELFSLDNDLDLIDISDFNKIEFKNVSFKYDKPIYENFNFTINKGDIISIKGRSGSGKTTLLNLLLGLIKPDSGEILIDDKLNISSSTRNLFSLVPQENILFSGTIRENILLIHPNKTDDEILEALNKANVTSEITLDYKLNERGNGLSLGQIQRILIAIALLKDSPIILLDEFSSALDLENENKILDTLYKLDKTIIYISHRKLDIVGREILVGEDN